MGARISHTERRAGPRTAVDLPVDVFVDGFVHSCRVIEASPTGMVVTLNKALASRDPHIVGTYEIDVGGARRLRVTARTVWRRGASQAVRFVGLAEDEQIAISEMLRSSRQRMASDLDRLELAEAKDRRAHVPRVAA